ncbi:hypothetical protein K525DRAFT_208455 [Schizophyllum commune Loenen D]|nr:hypothetical protein K525DRAFT_208455 [Schizophyllum commune Loenen D]
MDQHLLGDIRLSTNTCSNCGACISARTFIVPAHITSSPHMSSPSQVDFYNQNLWNDDVSLANHNAAIRRTHQMLDQLYHNRWVLVKSIESKRAMLAPIRRLPPEILAMVIALAIANSFTQYPDSTVIAQHPVLRVCRRWRELGFATPQIWKKIVLYPLHLRTWRETFLSCVQRSKALPLDIRLIRRNTEMSFTLEQAWKDRASDPDLGSLDAVGDALLACAPRWRYLQLGDVPLPTKLCQGQEPPPLLQLMSLFLGESRYGLARENASRSVGQSLPENFFLNCHALQYVRIEGPKHNGLHLPWSQLNSLHLDGCPPTDDKNACLDILRQCYSLRSLTLGATTSFKPASTDAPVVLPELQKLTLLGSAYEALHLFNGPKLQAISLIDEQIGWPIQDEGLHSASHYEALMRFASSAPATSLRITRLGFEVYTHTARDLKLNELACAYPNISQLRLDDQAASSATRRLASLVHTKPDVWPMLTSLELPALSTREYLNKALIAEILHGRVHCPSAKGVKLEEIEAGICYSNKDRSFVENMGCSGVKLFARLPKCMQRPSTLGTISEGESFIIDTAYALSQEQEIQHAQEDASSPSEGE